MNGLVLVAAGGLAREVLALEVAAGDVEETVLVDDDPTLWGRTVGGRPVVGGLDAVAGLDDHRVVVCAGRGTARAAIVERLSRVGVGADRFASVVHPSVGIPPGCSVGAGSIVLAGTVLTADVQVGNHVVVMPNATLTHDDVVDDYATICAGVTLGGGVRVGAGAYLGMASAVRENVEVGSRATLGMGAVLLEDLPPAETWVGVPARPLRSLVMDMGESA